MATKDKAPKPRKAPTRSRKKTIPIDPEHVATRAYFIHLEQGGDPFENWVRAERELATA